MFKGDSIATLVQGRSIVELKLRIAALASSRVKTIPGAAVAGVEGAIPEAPATMSSNGACQGRGGRGLIRREEG